MKMWEYDGIWWLIKVGWSSRSCLMMIRLIIGTWIIPPDHRGTIQKRFLSHSHMKHWGSWTLQGMIKSSIINHYQAALSIINLHDSTTINQHIQHHQASSTAGTSSIISCITRAHQQLIPSIGKHLKICLTRTLCPHENHRWRNLWQGGPGSPGSSGATGFMGSLILSATGLGWVIVSYACQCWLLIMAVKYCYNGWWLVACWLVCCNYWWCG